MLTVKHLAAVAISSASYGYDRRYKYVVPVDLDDKVTVGIRVLVPFGKGNRKRVAVVLRIDSAENEDLSKFKPINSVIDSEPLLNDEMLELIFWIRNTTLCTYFEAFKTLIPIGMSVDFTQKYALAEGQDTLSEDGLSDKARELLKSVREDISALDGADGKAAAELEKAGFNGSRSAEKAYKGRDS